MSSFIACCIIGFIFGGALWILTLGIAPGLIPFWLCWLSTTAGLYLFFKELTKAVDEDA
jgi:hypothetical protein